MIDAISATQTEQARTSSPRPTMCAIRSWRPHVVHVTSVEGGP